MEQLPTNATVKTPAANFTGDVYLNPVFHGDGTSHLVVGLVRFTPGARTNWQSVWTPAGQEHWHGGTAGNFMCHYAVLDETAAGDATSWLEPVTDEQYTAANTAAGEAR